MKWFLAFLTALFVNAAAYLIYNENVSFAETFIIVVVMVTFYNTEPRTK